MIEDICIEVRPKPLTENGDGLVMYVEGAAYNARIMMLLDGTWVPVDIVIHEE